jgi:chemotaxis signal transduction protein
MPGGDFVTLALGKAIFAVPVDYMREILDYRPASKIPGMARLSIGPD